ncbi:uncharacterized protein LOC122649486 isoform X2 [Telopea speciosissima]|uniref:uncharacterized protein LOC122649486 isoform X2 n=1 Tax=Telopea speciosissima TaxID=54955 RepID=UPI001CC3BDC6|nr:uncharacterized protein LOC122649486 isoform X2 [Telopea speciosissima]
MKEMEMETEKDMEAPLDFELEDPLLSPPVPTKKRGKGIGLDDLLKDFFKEKKKRNEREFKRAKSRICYNSDEDEETAHLSELVNQCQQKMQEIGDEHEIPLWGLHVFGNQAPPLPLGSLELRSCKLLQSLLNSELNLVLGLTAEKGETFFEGLLINGWLSKLVFRCGHVEEHLAVWTFNLMLYSSKEELRASGCDFWCAILPSRDEAEQPSLKIDWFPSSVNLKQALEIYGYLLDSSSVVSSLPEVVHAASDSDCRGPPQNIRCWIKFLTACCGVRGTWSIFSTSEAEEFLGVIISLFLDRQLQGLYSLLSECMVAIVSYFEDQEWNISCAEVAKALASRLPKDLNCLRVMECISGVDTRIKQLKREVAFQILINCLDGKLTDAEQILAWLMSIDMRDKTCDYFKVYIHLALAENWLFSNPLVEEKPLILEMWGAFLRNCSCQITNRELSSYASKVRNKASYILQSTIH